MWAQDLKATALEVKDESCTATTTAVSKEKPTIVTDNTTVNRNSLTVGRDFFVGTDNPKVFKDVFAGTDKHFVGTDKPFVSLGDPSYDIDNSLLSFFSTNNPIVREDVFLGTGKPLVGTDNPVVSKVVCVSPANPFVGTDKPQVGKDMFVSTYNSSIQLASPSVGIDKPIADTRKPTVSTSNPTGDTGKPTVSTNSLFVLCQKKRSRSLPVPFVCSFQRGQLVGSGDEKASGIEDPLHQLSLSARPSTSLAAGGKKRKASEIGGIVGSFESLNISGCSNKKKKPDPDQRAAVREDTGSGLGLTVEEFNLKAAARAWMLAHRERELKQQQERIKRKKEKMKNKSKAVEPNDLLQPLQALSMSTNPKQAHLDQKASKKNHKAMTEQIQMMRAKEEWRYESASVYRHFVRMKSLLSGNRIGARDSALAKKQYNKVRKEFHALRRMVEEGGSRGEDTKHGDTPKHCSSTCKKCKRKHGKKGEKPPTNAVVVGAGGSSSRRGDTSRGNASKHCSSTCNKCKRKHGKKGERRPMDTAVMEVGGSRGPDNTQGATAHVGLAKITLIVSKSKHHKKKESQNRQACRDQKYATALLHN